MAHRLVAVLCVLIVVVGCTVLDYAQSPAKIGLLAPFEGRYREVGYDALYAARLALADAGVDHIELLAVDDGGTVTTATARARALADDPQVKAVIVLGYDAAHTDTLAALADLPVVIAGDWGVDAPDSNHYILASAEISDMLTVDPRITITKAAQADAPVTGGTVFGLAQYPALRSDLAGVQVISSGTLPDAAFTARILEANPFAEPPGLLATTVYDATGMLVQTISNAGTTRTQVIADLTGITYIGINGEIRFVDSYWRSAPTNMYIYEDRQLAPANGEQ